ncbi:MAG: NAD(P)-dependent oxidoreductase [Rhodobiaceae bacterium]|nr:NAD(P)-dependent oxidoreductase [Rhodobiaceae bacterium]
MTKSVGIIGLGHMGGAVARRFLKLGYHCTVFDTVRERMDALEKLGADKAESPRGVADQCSVVISLLPSPEISKSVALGFDGIIQGSKITHYIEASTIGLSAVREIGAELRQKNIELIDAPISGGPPAIEAYTLTTMISGSPEALKATKDVMAAFCKKVFHVGDEPGHAQACKLVNNAMSLSNMVIASEAAVFGVAAGLDPGVMIDVVNASTGRSAVTEDKFPKYILNRRFDYGGALATGEKDLKLFVEEARKLGALTALSPIAAEIWHKAGAESDPSHDGTELIKWFEAPLGVVVGKPE